MRLDQIRAEASGSGVHLSGCNPQQGLQVGTVFQASLISQGTQSAQAPGPYARIAIMRALDGHGAGSGGARGTLLGWQDDFATRCELRALVVDQSPNGVAHVERVELDRAEQALLDLRNGERSFRCAQDL